MQAKRTRELLLSNALIRTNRDYRLLLSASSVSNLGDGIAMVALPWLATMLTSDPLLIAGSLQRSACHGFCSHCPPEAGPTAWIVGC
jgi:hypothetical protein